MQERYIRWILGVDWRTLGYIARKEAKQLSSKFFTVIR